MPVDEFNTSTMAAGSRPKRLPIMSASTPIRKPPADTRLFNAFMACAEPTSPVRVIEVPIQDSAGRTRSRMASLPPNMMASSPVLARGTPPDTGASTMCAPAAATCSARARVMVGTPELISTTTASLRSPASMPFGPSRTACTIALVGRIVMMMSEAAASSRFDAATVPPNSLTNSLARSAEASTICSG